MLKRFEIGKQDHEQHRRMVAGYMNPEDRIQKTKAQFSLSRSLPGISGLAMWLQH